jgi:predicted Zn-dependent peptidase
MIEYKKYTLDNGLRLLVHRDESTPIVSVNTLYDVGARDEDPSRTGFAHLFEHLMFGGSVNIPSFDTPLQKAGGHNNAFTNNDITNYYDTLPVNNIETAFWLESDRMLSLAFTPQSLEVQRKVVIEEFTQRYLNQPYGDLWLKMRPLAYQVHPYKWATIGERIEHIADAQLDDVKAFFSKHYHPGNAILSVAGNVEPEKVRDLVERWYGNIPGKVAEERNLPEEPIQNSPRYVEIESDVPQDAIHLAWHMPGRHHPDYYACDLTTDVLSQGHSSRLYKTLVRDKQLFTSVNAYIMGSIDPGLIVISGMIAPGVSHDMARDSIYEVLDGLITNQPEGEELAKVKNKFEAHHVFGETNALSRAMSLGYFELLGDANGVNTVLDHYREVSGGDISTVVRQLLSRNRVNELRYIKKLSK